MDYVPATNWKKKYCSSNPVRKMKLKFYRLVRDRCGVWKGNFVLMILFFAPWPLFTWQHYSQLGFEVCDTYERTTVGSCNAQTGTITNCTFDFDARSGYTYHIDPYDCIANFRKFGLDHIPVSSCSVYRHDEIQPSVHAIVWRNSDLTIDNSFRVFTGLSKGEWILDVDMSTLDQPDASRAQQNTIYMCGPNEFPLFLFFWVSMTSGIFTTVVGFAADFKIFHGLDDPKFQVNREKKDTLVLTARRVVNFVKPLILVVILLYTRTLTKNMVMVYYSIARTLNAIISIDWLNMLHLCQKEHVVPAYVEDESW